MLITIVILKICALAIAGLLVMLTITLSLPLHMVVNEVNTDKKLKAHIAIWDGLFRIPFTYPMVMEGVSGWMVKHGRDLFHRIPSGKKSTPGTEHQKTKYSWSTFGRVRDRLPTGIWHQLKRAIQFDPWRGVITLGFANPAITGFVFGGAYNLIMCHDWPDLRVEPDFVDKHSQFKGYARLKIYPARLIFLAVKYGFKTLKLFRSEKRRMRNTP